MLLSQLKKLDAYPKTIDDFRIKTYSGAIVSILSGIFILWLFFSQVLLYTTTEIHHELFVDTTLGEKLKINMDITFHHLPCAYLSLDAMDISGEHQFDVSHNIYKKRLSSSGHPIMESEIKEEEINKKAVVNPNDKSECGSCYGAEDPSKGVECCNTCDDVKSAYNKKGWGVPNLNTFAQCVREGFNKKVVEQNGEGCQVYGFIIVNKVAGNFHFAPGKSFQQNHMHVHDFHSFQGSFNMSHTINRLSFGTDYPGIKNPLDDVIKTELAGVGMFQYFVKIVPTMYEALNGNTIKTNQYSVTEHYILLAKKGQEPTNLPGLFFMYDLSPIMMRVSEKHKSFASFLTGLCAIIGGVFTVAGILDSLIYQSTKNLQKKIDLGKQG